MWIALIGLALLSLNTAVLVATPPMTATLVGVASFLLYAGLLFRGMQSVRSRLVERTVWRSDDANESRVALTFDDGPHPTWTPHVLETLAQHGVKATFFVVGENVRAYPGLVRRIVEEGHEVGCHADSHARSTPVFRPARMEREMRDCLAAIHAEAGVTPRFYRPPLGVRSPIHHGLAARNDMLIVGMARRGFDGSPDMTPERMVERVVGKARGGEILTLHDGKEPGRDNGRCVAADALPDILEGFAARGLQSALLSELLVERPYRETPERAWTGRTRGGHFGNAVFAWLARSFGSRPALVLLVFVAAWFVVGSGEGRRASIDLRRRLHGRSNPFVELWWAYRHFFVYGKTLLERLVFLQRGGELPQSESIGYDNVREVVEGDEGMLMVSAHFGDWSAASRGVAVHGRKLSVVAARGMGIGPHQVLRDASSAGYELIDAEADAASVGMGVAAALTRGGAVALLGDRLLAEKGVGVPFLGGEARFPTGLWGISMVTGAPAVVFFAVPDREGHFQNYLYGPIRVPRVPREERQEVLRHAVAQFAGYLEECVRAHPFHWGNFYDFWGAG